MADENRQAFKNRIIIVVLVLVFFLPVLSAWYLVFFTDGFRNGDATGHGILIEPPRQLPDVKLYGGQGGLTQTLHGKWTFLALADGACDEHCRENLYRMRQIRLAAGNDLNRVQRILMHNGIGDEIDEIALKYPGLLFLSMEGVDQDFKETLFREHNSEDKGLFLVDARGYLMMYYPYDTNPSGIIRDLKRLLRLSSTD